MPLQVSIEVTRRCPLECLQCYNNLLKGDMEAKRRESSREIFVSRTEKGFQEVLGGWPDENQEGLEERACRACVYCFTSRDRSTASGVTLRGGRHVESLF
jgi:MoaA/NifB/PqqE/SkfB family radical SAM enzyme